MAKTKADIKAEAKRRNEKTTANKRVPKTVRVDIEDLENTANELSQAKDQLATLNHLLATFPTLRACYQEIMAFIDENPEFTLPAVLIPSMMTLEQIVTASVPLAGIIDNSRQTVFKVQERIEDEWLQSQT